MERRYFIDQISKESLEKMMVCFAPKFKTYEESETIMAYSDQMETVAVLISGSAKLYYIDENGDTSLLEVYKDGDIFGEAFSLPIENYEYIVVADSPCKVVYLDYNHIITPCEHVCPHHTQLINNLFIMTAQRSQALSLHISILNQHTTRKKLMAYLKYARSNSGASVSETFSIPISLGSLAEYLCVDRTAMMREIRLMKKDGLIDSDRRVFKLKY